MTACGELDDHHLRAAREMINSMQGELDGLSIRLSSVYSLGNGECDICLRLTPSPQLSTGKTLHRDPMDQMDQLNQLNQFDLPRVDSSNHRALMRKMRRRFPLLVVECRENKLDGAHELHIVVPNREEAWNMSSRIDRPSRADVVLRWLQLACVACVLSALASPERLHSWATNLEERVRMCLVTLGWRG